MESEDLFEEELTEEVISAIEEQYVKPTEDALPDEDPDENMEENTEETETEQDKGDTNSTAPANSVTPSTATSSELKLFQLPLTRIRNIMKLDPDLHIASHEAVFLVTRATELFIQSLARESYTYTTQSKKKTLQKRDVDFAITAVDSLLFLDGAMTF